MQSEMEVRMEAMKIASHLVATSFHEDPVMLADRIARYLLSGETGFTDLKAQAKGVSKCV